MIQRAQFPGIKMMKSWKIRLSIVVLIDSLSRWMGRSVTVATTARSTDDEVGLRAGRRAQFARRLQAVCALLPQGEYVQLQRDWQLPALATQP